MKKTPLEYANTDLDVFFSGHLVIKDWRLRGQLYTDKLLTLGYSSMKNPISLKYFVQLIGPPDLSEFEKDSGMICYITPDDKQEGICWLFDVIKFRINAFMTNGYNMQFIQDRNGMPKYIHEVLSPVFPNVPDA